MKQKLIRAAAWLLISILAVGIITDFLLALGCPHAAQYIYNFLAFCAIVGLLVVALGDNLKEYGE